MTLSVTKKSITGIVKKLENEKKQNNFANFFYKYFFLMERRMRRWKAPAPSTQWTIFPDNGRAEVCGAARSGK